VVYSRCADQFAVLDACCADQAFRDGSYLFDRSANHDDFKAVVLVHMDMRRAYDGVVMRVLKGIERIGQPVLFMVVDDGDSSDKLLRSASCILWTW